jgi:predicted transcriptional regulator
MLKKLLQILSITCRHKRTSQPFTAAPVVRANADWEAVGSGPTHYIVCLDCGKKFTYDWEHMRVVW